MQQIIKQAGPSRQVLEIVNFAFMNIINFSIKTALYYQLIYSATELDFRP